MDCSWRVGPPVCRHAIHKAHDARQDLYTKPPNQPWHIFHKNADEERGEVLGRQHLHIYAINQCWLHRGGGDKAHGQVFIHDFTPFEVAMEEMDHATGFITRGM